ncbi:MAG: hypothetical protein WA705_20410 [Candidatus Ozemobacteraceae bacterium]
MKHTSRYVLIVALSLGLVGCGIVPNKFTIETPQLKDLGESLKDAADRLDPLAIKKLTEDSRTVPELKSKLDEALRRANTIRTGLLVIPGDTRVKLVFRRSLGRLRVSAWIDERDNPLLTNIRCEDQTLSLPVTFDLAHKLWQYWYDHAPVPPMRLSGHFAFPGFLTPAMRTGYANGESYRLRDLADSEYQSAITAAFRAFLADPGFHASTGTTHFDIADRLGGPGKHAIFLSITPERTDATGHWMLNYMVVKQSPDHEEVLFEGQTDDGVASTPLGTAIEAKIVTIQVATAEVAARAR